MLEPVIPLEFDVPVSALGEILLFKKPSIEGSDLLDCHLVELVGA